jgi:uncharacterized protein GlcG (DUF336 family)
LPAGSSGLHERRDEDRYLRADRAAEIGSYGTGNGQAALPAGGRGGGVININDEVVGAIGAVGAPGSDLNENCAKAGPDKIRDRLK